MDPLKKDNLTSNSIIDFKYWFFLAGIIYILFVLVFGPIGRPNNDMAGLAYWFGLPISIGLSIILSIIYYFIRFLWRIMKRDK